jgi:putative transposase
MATRGFTATNTVRAPLVDDERVAETSGERRRFFCAILPASRPPKITKMTPLLYLHGLWRDRTATA